MKYAIIKEERVVQSNGQKVTFTTYKTNDGNCCIGNAIVGTRCIVTGGRKIQKGTLVTIERVMANKFERVQKSSWSGELINPACLVRLPDNTTVWTQGKNLTRILNEMTGYSGEIEASSDDEADKKLHELHLPSDLGLDAYAYNAGNITVYYSHFTDGGMHVYNKMVTMTDDLIGCVAYDFRDDTYEFLVFTREFKKDNLVKVVAKGEPKRFDDMGGDPGLGAATKAYEEWVRSIA